MDSINAEIIAILRRDRPEVFEPCEITEPVGPELRGEQDLSLVYFNEWLTAALDAVPADRHATARISIGGGYDERPSLQVTYQRRETPEEVERRVCREVSYTRDRLNRERDEYERLKAKYA